MEGSDAAVGGGGVVGAVASSGAVGSSGAGVRVVRPTFLFTVFRVVVSGFVLIAGWEKSFCVSHLCRYTSYAKEQRWHAVFKGTAPAKI